MILDWRQQRSYEALADGLSRPLWAWQFLRRHPGYRHDWAMFIERWRSLEADYGKAPNRDFPRWKNDPRAVISADEKQLICEDELGAACVIEDGKVLIECWMGAKWGFYKFPLDPDYDMPKVPQELLWREQDVEAGVLAASMPSPDMPVSLSLTFDLRFSLKEQLDSARLLLSGERKQRHARGVLKLRVRELSGVWIAMLRLLDARARGEEAKALPAIAKQHALESTMLLRETERMLAGGYKEILLLAD